MGDPGEGRPLLDGVRVLLVDDHGDSREAVAEFLMSHGANVVPVDSAEAGLRSLQKGPAFDVVVSDLRMPDRNGYGLVRDIRGGMAGRPDLPAIAITAYADLEGRDQALAAGFDDYVPKTSSLLLTRRILRVLGRPIDGEDVG